MPGARCTRSRAWCVVNTRVSHHGYTGSPGIPARNGFNGFLRALLGDRAFLPPSLADCSAKLDASVGASGPNDFAVRKHAPSSEAPFTSTASRSASVTIAIRPSVERDGKGYIADLGQARSGNFHGPSSRALFTRDVSAVCAIISGVEVLYCATIPRWPLMRSFPLRFARYPARCHRFGRVRRRSSVAYWFCRP
jgi:hypothetical protein